MISTSGTARVDALQARDEDLLRFTPTALGTTTAGTWELYFDGSAVGLAASSEDIGAATVDDLGKLYLVTKGKFSAASQTGIQGDSNDIFGCILGATGENSTTCTFFAFFDGELVRFKQAIDGISLGTATTAAFAQAAVPTDNGDEPVQFAVIPDEVITDDTEYNEYDLPQAEEIGAEEIRVYLPLISD